MTELDLRPFKTMPNVLGIPPSVTATFGSLCGSRDIKCDGRTIHLSPHEFDIVTAANSLDQVSAAIEQREKEMRELFLSGGAALDMSDLYITVRSNWAVTVYEDGSVLCALKRMSATHINGEDFKSFLTGYVE